MPARSSKQTEISILRSPVFAKCPWLMHGFSTRVGGDSRAYGKKALNLGFTLDDSRITVDRNRVKFLKKLLESKNSNKQSDASQLITLRQVHSDIIRLVDSPEPGPLAGDGLITNTPGLLLAIQTADCLPIILADSKNRAVGVFHAGWRGTIKRIVEKGVGEMRRRFASHPRDLKAAIGPGIHSCCYEVGPEVRDNFESQFNYAATLFREIEEFDEVRQKYPMLFLTARAPGHSVLPTKIFLDLVDANRRQLIAAGVPAKSIETSDLCTSCRTDLLFSYRAEKGKTGRMLAAVGIRNEI